MHKEETAYDRNVKEPGRRSGKRGEGRPKQSLRTFPNDLRAHSITCRPGQAQPEQNRPRVGTTKSGGLYLGKVPPESRFGLLSLKFGNFFGSPAPKTAPSGPKRATTSSGMLGRPNCVPCAPNWPRSVADPARGPPSAVCGHFWPVWPRVGGEPPFWAAAVRSRRPAGSRKRGSREATG